jgi:hypothetical protein
LQQGCSSRTRLAAETFSTPRRGSPPLARARDGAGRQTPPTQQTGSPSVEGANQTLCMISQGPGTPAPLTVCSRRSGAGSGFPWEQHACGTKRCCRSSAATDAASGFRLTLPTASERRPGFLNCAYAVPMANGKPRPPRTWEPSTPRHPLARGFRNGKKQNDEYNERSNRPGNSSVAWAER